MSEKLIFTAGYGALSKIPREVERFSISQGQPQWIQPPFPRIRALAPSWAMLNLNRAEYDKAMMAQLEGFDAQLLYGALPEKSVLLCYERPGTWCHRRMVAEWIERELKIEVPEWGQIRRLMPAYADLKEQEKGCVGPKQETLF